MATHVAMRSPVTACTFPTASSTGEEPISAPGELARLDLLLWIKPELGVSIALPRSPRARLRRCFHRAIAR